MKTIKNVAAFTRKPGALRVMLDKAASRFFDERGLLDAAQNHEWLSKQAIDFSDFARQENETFWKEAVAFGKNLKAIAETKLDEIGVPLGGGGHYAMLYFLTRMIKPPIVLETGVAAGYSSESFLSAITKNKKGKLFSSDFPYFRIENPEHYIGLLVDPKHREQWSLYIEGDQKNLKQILPQVKAIDLFHYDSDKRYRSKKRTYGLVKGKLSSEAHCVFDDIQDDSFFHDLASSEGLERGEWDVIAYRGKYIGWLHPG